MLGEDITQVPFCDLLGKILNCGISGLEKNKKKRESLQAQVTALKDFRNAQRDNPSASKELLDGLSSELASREKELAAARAGFTDDDDKTLTLLKRRLSYVTNYCANRGWPESFYSAQAGLEGGLDTSSGFKLTNGKFVADLFFATPLIYLPAPNAVSKVIAVDTGLLGKDASGGPVVNQTKALEFPSESRRLQMGAYGTTWPRSPVFTKANGGRDCKWKSNQARPCTSLADLMFEEENRLVRKHKLAKGEAEKAAKEFETEQKKAERAKDKLVQESRHAEDKENSISADPSSLQLKLLLEALDRRRTAATDLAAAKNLAETKQKEAKQKEQEAKDEDWFCAAADSVERIIAILDQLDAGETRRESRRWRGYEDPADPARQVRAGPFTIPDPIKRQTAPIWGFARVKNQILADLTAEEPAEVSRLTASGGLHYALLNIGSFTTIGPSVALSAIFGDIPVKMEFEGSKAFRHYLLFDGGLLLQTRYRVAEIDKESSSSGVIGQFYVGYRQAAYLDLQQKSESDRFVADLRLTFGAISSKTVRPMLYLSIDKSLHGTLNRDRAGILLDVDLKTLFQGVVKEGQKTAAQSSSDGSKQPQ